MVGPGVDSLGKPAHADYCTRWGFPSPERQGEARHCPALGPAWGRPVTAPEQAGPALPALPFVLQLLPWLGARHLLVACELCIGKSFIFLSLRRRVLSLNFYVCNPS